nr:hypothetical protein [Tanacetum cinerariifolium]
VFDSGGRGAKKKSDVNVTIGSCSDFGFPYLSDVVVYGGISIPMGYVPSGMRDVTRVTGNAGTPNEVGHDYVMEEILTSYANKLSSTSLTKANLRKLDANVQNGADYDVWLPLDLVHNVNDRIKNTLYGYFIDKRLAFPVVEWFIRNS